jgi:hypothetical protein
LENGDYPSSNYSNTKRRSCGPQRQIKIWLSSRISCPSHQSSQLLAKKEQLLLYLTATTHVVSTAIIVERQEDDHTYPVQ